MRHLTRVTALIVVPGVAACASAGSPPGGPPDVAPPQVIEFSPDSGAVNFAGRAVTVRFDETINDRGTGASALEALVLISPRDGEPRVSWDRNRIAVRPRSGFLPNTAYSITIAPGIGDLRGNRSTTSRTVVFSTGGSIPQGAIAGNAFDWPGQQVSRTAWIEALRVADSAVFVTTADSAGRFEVAALNPGLYLVRGYVDQNSNRVLDRTEAWDSVRVTVASAPAAPVELLFAQRDTFPARMLTIAVTDSVTLRVEFDKPLDPAQAFGTELVRIVRADSTPVPIIALATLEQADAARAVAAARAGDSTAARDTTPRPAPDSAPARPRPSRAAPPSTLILTVGQPLTPGTSYRVTVTGVRTLLGRESTSTRVLTTPARDTTAAPRRAPDATPWRR